MARRPSLHVAEQVFNLLASLVGQVFNLPALHQSSLPALLTLGLFGCPALAQTNLPPHPIPESQRWATITHPGNEAYTFTDGVFTRTFGRVDYEYQISRTELTGGEWFEFVNAYAPYVSENDANASTFTSRGILRVAPLEYIIAPGAVNRPVEVSWRYAARYINWLHNDKATNREAFEQGAYDTSTFSTNPDGTFNDQQTRSPGARYWLPSEDEWAKAVFWDPNKNGPDQPGYWTYANATDAPLTPGLPQSGGQTSAGFAWGFNGNPPPPEVAAYTLTQSPWGLWDASGGVAEWIEEPYFDPIGGDLPTVRFARGSAATDFILTVYNTDPLLGGIRLASPDNMYGVRIARGVPPPHAGALAFMYMLVWPRHGRRHKR